MASVGDYHRSLLYCSKNVLLEMYFKSCHILLKTWVGYIIEDQIHLKIIHRRFSK